jgi:hypothetical protein
MDGIGAGNVFGNFNYGGNSCANCKQNNDHTSYTPLLVLFRP